MSILLRDSEATPYEYINVPHQELKRGMSFKLFILLLSVIILCGYAVNNAYAHTEEKLEHEVVLQETCTNMNGSFYLGVGCISLGGSDDKG